MIEVIHNDNEMPAVQTTFSLELLEPASQPIIEQVIDRVHHRTESMAQMYIDNGRDLLLAKQHIPRGMWVDFLQSQFNWSHGTAVKMMQICRHFGDLHLQESQVSVAVLGMLTHNDVPQSIREIATSAISNGGIVNRSDLLNVIREHDSGMADHIQAIEGYENVKRNRRAIKDLILQIAELNFAVRNMQKALSTAYGVPFRSNVADALQQLQNISDALIASAPKPGYTSRQGFKSSSDTSTSRYVGARRDKRDKRRSTWQASIKYKGKNIYLGSFATEEEAARAYDAKARELYGDTAKLNFPEEM